MKKFILVMLSFMFVLILASFSRIDDQAADWKVPEKYDKMENPYEADNASLKVGKSLWKKHCASCHGSDGLGDGSKAKRLDTPTGDFTSDAFQKQTDGAIFYKSKFGRDEMPNYEKKIRYDEDMWHLVNYMRTFK